MKLYIEFGAALNFSQTIDYSLLLDELVIDQQLGFTPRWYRRRDWD